MDLEGKVGNKRNIGEASAFLPVACTQDRLLFTDLKFRADNLSNREANIGLGARVQRQDGIAGGYIYFDRKKSGETDKFYNQITLGAEWLADDWETRTNVYIPLNGSKAIGSGVVVSDPYLAGTGIYIDRGAFQIKETPMYGADAELGFKTTENLWLYGGGFTFHGNDVPTITGARVRAKYDLTDKVSLNAEGQYDDERGRQGWLGARLSVPFGNSNATRSRMTQSPVRDVDIVTQAKTTFEPQTTTALTNPESGDAQRVIYVDNTAAAGGDGSLEKPYNTLADAQSDLQSYDVVYIHAGDGKATHQDQGFTINQRGVAVIGEASPFVYQGYLLRAAGNRPVLSNTTPDGDGVTVAADDVLLTGFAVQGADRDGVVVRATNGGSAQNVMLHNLVATDNRMGVYIHGADGGAVSAAVEATLATNNRQHGFAVYDDTDNRFDVDLGGGGVSAGLNGLFGNRLEDLAIDYDGRTLSAQNNWWGQASGLYQDVPNGTNKPQIYYGAPINDDLAIHLTFDDEWTDDTTAYDRSGNGNHGTFSFGLTRDALYEDSRRREGIAFDGVGNIRITRPYVGLSDRTQLTTLVSGTDPEANQNLLVLQATYFSTGISINRRAGVRIVPEDHPDVPGSNVLSSSLPQNQPYEIVGVWDHGKHAGYNNALLYGENEVPRDNILNLNRSYIDIGLYRHLSGGCSGCGQTPKIDDVRIYNRALSTDEIAELYRMDTNSVVNSAGALQQAPY